MNNYTDENGNIFTVSEATEIDSSSPSPVIGHLMIGLGLVAIAGASIALASSVSFNRSDNPLPEFERVPSTQELVKIRGVSYDLARKIREIISSTQRAEEKEIAIALLFDSEMISFNSWNSTHADGCVVNLGDRYEPSIAHVYNDVWIQVSIENRRQRRLHAGGWYVATLDQLSNSKTEKYMSKIRRNNPVKSVDMSEIRNKLDETIRSIANASSDAKIKSIVMDAMESMNDLKKMILSNRVIVSKGGQVMEQVNASDEVDLAQTEFVESVIDLDTIPLETVHELSSEYVFDTNGKPMIDRFSKDSLLLHLYDNPLNELIIDISKNVAKFTDEASLLELVATVYSDIYMNTQDDVYVDLLTAIASNRNSNHDTFQIVYDTKNIEVWIAILRNKNSPENLAQKIIKQSGNNPFIRNAMIFRGTRR